MHKLIYYILEHTNHILGNTNFGRSDHPGIATGSDHFRGCVDFLLKPGSLVQPVLINRHQGAQKLKEDIGHGWIMASGGVRGGSRDRPIPLKFLKLQRKSYKLGIPIPLGQKPGIPIPLCENPNVASDCTSFFSGKYFSILHTYLCNLIQVIFFKPFQIEKSTQVQSSTR